MGGALVDNVRHWCRHHWSKLNSPCVASDVVAPETVVSFKSLKEARSRSVGRPDLSGHSGSKDNVASSSSSQRARRRAQRTGKQPSKGDREVEFFTECGEATRYILQEVIGKGSYGVVCSAIDTHTGEKVAIKKINDIFEHVSDATRILREIKLLRLLRHPDIVELKHIMLPPSRKDFKDIYVVFELMESDLHQVIKANDDLTPEHYQFFLYQLLRALKYIHTANVFHRDLKPKNVLANADCKLKVCDFGLARVAFNDAPTAIFWTDYVATRWYRAPELCGSFFSEYTPAVDIWSIGCIFAEVLLGKPLFPGKNVVHQLDLITDFLGTPPSETISKIRNEKARQYLASMMKKNPVPFAEKFPKADPLALKLLQRLLAFDPKDRPTAEEALSDPYFKGMSKIEREPSAQPLGKLEFEFERRKVSKEDMKELIYREILEYHPETLKEYLHGRGSGRFMYPSAADRLKRQMFYLEENYSNGSTSVALEREHSSLPRECILDFRENGIKASQVSENIYCDKSVMKASFVARQQLIEGNHPNGSSGSVANGEGAYPRRLFKSASVNGAVTSSASTSAKTNPSLRSEVVMPQREDSAHHQDKPTKPPKKSHGFGFELTKRFLKI